MVFCRGGVLTRRSDGVQVIDSVAVVECEELAFLKSFTDMMQQQGPEGMVVSQVRPPTTLSSRAPGTRTTSESCLATVWHLSLIHI